MFLNMNYNLIITSSLLWRAQLYVLCVMVVILNIYYKFVNNILYVQMFSMFM